MMKIAVALLALAATASAIPKISIVAAAAGPVVIAGKVAAGNECFPERITACQRHLSSYPSANCEGLCGLCALVEASNAQGVATPGSEYCKHGIEQCTATCNKGLEVCAKCGIVFQTV